MKKPLILVFLFFVLAPAFLLKAQEPSVKEVLDKVTHFYKNKNSYRIEMTFSMLRGLSGNKVTEIYDGTLEKNGDYIRTVFLESEVHKFRNGQVTVDDKKRTIIFSDLVTDHSSPAEVASLLNYFKKSQLTDGGEKKWICELVAVQNTFSQLPYGKVVLHIDKNNFSVLKQVLYFSTLVPFQDENSGGTVNDYGRLAIEMKHDFDGQVQKRSLKEFIIKETNQNLQLTGQYRSYQLIDQRK